MDLRYIFQVIDQSSDDISSSDSLLHGWREFGTDEERIEASIKSLRLDETLIQIHSMIQGRPSTNPLVTRVPRRSGKVS